MIPTKIKRFFCLSLAKNPKITTLTEYIYSTTLSIIMTRFLNIFLYGLLVQFFLQNWITFGRGRDMPRVRYIWLWKELFIAGGCLVLLRKPGIRYIRQALRTQQVLRYGILIFLLTIAWAAITHIYMLQLPLSTFILGLKYDFLGFLLVFLGYFFGNNIDAERIIKTYIRVIKYILLLAILRYAVILIKPGTLKFFGYNNYIYEGQAGGQAPAVYYTQINQGYPRNQFLFERPTTWGFFLVAMWPLFRVRYLAQQPIVYTRGRRVIYGINILITFSRAAYGAWIFEVIALGLLWHKHERKVYMKRFLLPILLIGGIVVALGFKSIMARGYSNRGHITMIQQGLEIFFKHPVIGAGLASVGPGSHWEGGMAFNPENQFLQILIELGSIGFLGWMCMYIWMNWVGIYAFLTQKTQEALSYLTAMSVGMVGLSISGLVLHSFVDRMIVYPFCLLFGLVLARYVGKQKTVDIETKKTSM